MGTFYNLVGDALELFGLDLSTKLGEVLQFFIYETVKIFFLLLIIVMVISFIQSYFPPERTKKLLSKYKGIRANILGAFLGIISPFCSCSSIPLFIGLNKAGVPLGASFSFLISSPLVDLASLFLLMNLMGVKISIAYVVVGVLIAIFGGVIIEKLNLQDEINLEKKEEVVESSCCGPKKEVVESSCCGTKTEEVVESNCCGTKEQPLTVVDRFKYAKKETGSVISGIWKYILISIFIGSMIHSVIPQELIISVIGEGNPFSVLIATLTGVPLYTDEMSAMVIGSAFFNKGVPIGTVLSFMMSAAALSLPSMIILKGVMSKKLLAIFMSIVTVGIIITGYLFNLIGFIF